MCRYQALVSSNSPHLFLSLMILLASVRPKLTHNRVVGFQLWSIGKVIIILFTYGCVYYSFLLTLINVRRSLRPICTLLPLRPIRLIGRCPHLLQIQTLLFPPPHFHYCLWPPLCCQTQIHNGRSRNIFRHSIMESRDLGLHLL